MSKHQKSTDTGYYVRNSRSGGLGVERIGPSGSATTSLATIQLPSGKVVKSIDRDLFDRAVRAATTKK